MLNLVTAISSMYAVQGVSLSAAGAKASTYTSAAASQGPTSGADIASGTSAQAAGTSASTANAASARSAPGATPSASASSNTSASAAGVASAHARASSGVAASKTRASPQSSASSQSLDRHFALGMQKSAGAYASDRLSSMVEAGPDASNTAAALETSEKRFRNIVSQIALSGGLASSTAEDDQGDPSADGSDASTAGAQAVYADHAA